jgi:hypothetical protein
MANVKIEDNGTLFTVSVLTLTLIIEVEIIHKVFAFIKADQWN